MLPITFTCPRCQSSLKSPSPIAAGKKIKCPKCGTIFLMSGPEEAGADDVIPAERPAVASRRRTDDSSTFADDVERFAERDGDEDDVEEREERRPRRKRRKKANAGLSMTLMIGGVVLALAVVAGGGYFAWDIFINSGRNVGTGNEEPLAYVPTDSSMVMFLDFETLMSQPGIGAQIEQSVIQSSGSNIFADCKRNTGLEFKELLHQVTYGFKVAYFQRLAPNRPPPGLTMVVKSKLPFDQRKISRSLSGSVAKKLKGKTYYECSNDPFPFLFMPSDRIMILTNVPENELGTIIGSTGTQPLLSADTVAMTREAQNSHFWIVVPVTGSIQQNLKKGIDGLAATTPAEMKAVAAALSQAKAGALWVKFAGGQVHVTAGMSCADDASAKQVAADLQTSWDKNTKGFAAQAQLGLAMAMVPKNLQAFVKEFIDSIRFASRGAVAQVSAQLSAQSLENLVREGQNQARMMQNPGAFPGQGGMPNRPFPPPGMPRPGPRAPRP